MQQELLRVLIQTNLVWLDQAIQLVDSINDEQYAASPRGLTPHKAGAHLRHILDFYESFINGLETGYVDYDARRRDVRTSVDRNFAIERIRWIALQLECLTASIPQKTLFVRVEDATEEVSGNAWMPSSILRELQSLSSHTIHHFALIAITLEAFGVRLNPAFGMAPSTLRHQQRVAAA